MISPSNISAIRSNYSLRGSSRWIVLAGGLGVAAAVAVTGCSNGSTDAATTAARHALKLASSTSQKVESLTAQLTEQVNGTTTDGMTGTVQMQLRPAPVIEAKFTIASKTTSPINLDEILTDDAVYFKNPAFAKKTGKSWIKVDRSQLNGKSGPSIAAMLQNLEGSNPLDQTRLFTASTDVHQIGTQVINGVSTTEYAGTYSPSVAFSQLPAKMRTLLGPMLRSMGRTRVRFHVWIDAHHLIRKADAAETVRGQTYLTTFVVTSINQPVKVTLPTASMTAPLPKI